MLDFYIIKTSVDLLRDKLATDALVQHIGYYCQPEIVGTPYEEAEDTYCLRFAVRRAGLLDMERDFVKTLKLHFVDEVELQRVTKL